MTSAASGAKQIIRSHAAHARPAARRRCRAEAARRGEARGAGGEGCRAGCQDRRAGGGEERAPRHPAHHREAEGAACEAPARAVRRQLRAYRARHRPTRIGAGGGGGGKRPDRCSCRTGERARGSAGGSAGNRRGDPRQHTGAREEEAPHAAARAAAPRRCAYTEQRLQVSAAAPSCARSARA